MHFNFFLEQKVHKSTRASRNFTLASTAPQIPKHFIDAPGLPRCQGGLDLDFRHLVGDVFQSERHRVGVFDPGA
jgi:hypothetical protein